MNSLPTVKLTIRRSRHACLLAVTFSVAVGGLLLETCRGANSDGVLWTVARLNASRNDWPTLTGVDLRVEGRVAAQLKGQFRFQNCSLNFLMPPDLERRITASRTVEVTGRLRRDGNAIVFDVSQLKPLPTDLEQARSRELALRNGGPDDWYALAEWARERGEFYNDRELQELGQVYLVRGVGLERSKLNGDDFDGYFKLAEKSRTLGLPAGLVDDLQHLAFRAWWTSAGSAANPDAEQLAALEQRLKKVWPDCVRPGSPFPSELQQSYATEPTDAYRQAEPDVRQVFRRMLAASVQLRRLELEAADNGSNGAEIAERLVTRVPEFRSQADRYRQAALTYRLGQAATLSKADVQTLANELRTHQRGKDASEALLRWLVAKEQRLRPQTAPEFVELADEYLVLLKDDSRAVALLLEAHRREPESEDVRQRFGQLGYVFNGVSWTRPKELPRPSADPNRPTTPDPLTAGMTAEQVQRMLGQPTVRSRVGSARGAEEFWAYGRVGEGSRLLIELRHTDPDTPLRVHRFYHR